MGNGLINLLNIISKKNKNVSDKVKAKIITFSFFLLFCNMFLSSLGVYNGSSSVAAIVGIFITFVIIWFFADNHISFGDLINKPVVILFFLVGIFFLISAVLHKVAAFILISFIFLFVLPVFYFTVGNDYNNFLYMMSLGARYSYILMLIVSVFISPLSNGQYASFLGNPNGLGAFLSVIFVAVLYLYEINDNKKDRIINMFLIGSIFALCIFTKSRTTYLSLGFSFFIYVIYMIIDRRYNLRALIGRVIKIFVSSFISLILMFSLLTYVSNFILSLEENIFGQSFKIVFNPESSYNEITDLKGQLQGAAERGKKGIGDSNSFSSGRAEIWRTYLNDLNLTGHNADKLKVPYQGGYLEANAHNTYLQIAHSGGVVAGISFVVLNIMFAFYLLKVLFRGIRNRKIDIKYLFVGSMLISCEIIMMLSSVYYPYISAVSVVYYFVVGCFFVKPKCLDD